MAGAILCSDVYKRLWECRDFEIDHVWQRAVFLSAFLLACYAGYGTALISIATADNAHMPLPIANVLLFLIALVGLVLSLVWIMMAKGSKAWYEHYEEALRAVETMNPAVFDSGCDMRVQCADKTISGFSCPPTSSWLWNTKGGAYSVAKINIVIGHISAVVWLLIIIGHIAVAQKEFVCWRDLAAWLTTFTTAKSLIGVSVGSLLLFWIYSLSQIKSTFLKDE